MLKVVFINSIIFVKITLIEYILKNSNINIKIMSFNIRLIIKFINFILFYKILNNLI